MGCDFSDRGDPGGDPRLRWVAAASIAKLLFYIFLILFAVSLIAGLARRA